MSRIGLRIIGSLNVLALLFPVILSAQPHFQGDPKKMMEQRVERLEEALDLSEAQAAAILILEQEFAGKLDSLRSENLGRREMMGTVRSLRDEYDEKVENLLFEEQIEPYEKFREEEREAMQDRIRQRRRGGL